MSNSRRLMSSEIPLQLSTPSWSVTREHFHVADDSALAMDLMSAGIFELQMTPKVTSSALSIAGLKQPRWKEKSYT